MVEFKNVVFSYEDKQVLNGFSLKIEKGECVCLKGESGCGKTTALRLILGLETPISGEISVPKRISAVFQEDRLMEHLSIKRNIMLIDDSDPKRVDKLLKKAGLYEVRHKKISLLSGGMKRRTAILRAIVFGGDLLVLDEPFNGLDFENKRIMSEIIREEFSENGKSVLLVSHIKEDAELLDAKVVEME